MPFTVSHAAAVLPFRKLNLVWSAFIVGSMAPDFPYVIGNTDYRGVGHHFPGIIVFTIPAAFAALWLFHNLIKRPVIGLLPTGMQARLRGHVGEFKFGGRSRFFAILAAVLLGIATHVIWDSFTHAFTWPWQHFRWLHQRVRIPLVGAIPGYSALQYVSTIGGILALAVWIWRWYRKAVPVADSGVPPRQSRFGLAIAMFVIAGAAGLVRAVLVVGTPSTRANADLFLLILGVTWLALAFWQLLLYCVLVSTYQVWTVT